MSVKTEAVPLIECVKDSLVPHIHFEWHTHTKKVYYLETPGKYVGREWVPDESGVRRGVIVAEHCEHHAMFIGFVQTFLRGYKKAVSDYPKLKESALMADMGRISNGLLLGETDG